MSHVNIFQHAEEGEGDKPGVRNLVNSALFSDTDDDIASLTDVKVRLFVHQFFE